MLKGSNPKFQEKWKLLLLFFFARFNSFILIFKVKNIMTHKNEIKFHEKHPKVKFGDIL